MVTRSREEREEKLGEGHQKRQASRYKLKNYRGLKKKKISGMKCSALLYIIYESC